MSASREFAVLDVGVSIHGDPADLEYAGAFVDAYATTSEPGPAEIRARVEVRRAEIPRAGDADGNAMWVHRSKHRYWDVRAVGTHASSRWLTRPVAVDVAGRTARLATPPATTPAVTGEAAWHLCRSLALYSRDPHAAKLLHASAVVLEGRAVLFVGDVSAGKTTLMTAAVVKHRGVPLANDRVLVRLGAALSAHSWPSYASFTEGTLLDHPPLAEAARAYEAGRCGHRTQTWGVALRRAYTKDAKRVYPMTWLSDALGTRYRHSARLGAIVISTLAARIENPGVQRLDLDDDDRRARLAALLNHESFDAVEPSFRPWHGLALPAGAASATELVDRLRVDGVPVLALRAPASGYEGYLSSALEAAT